MKSFLTIFFSFSIIIWAVEPGQWDNFQDGTTQGWGSGLPNPNPPIVTLDGGPGGDGDAFLLVRSVGGGGAGSKLITFNSDQWSGDYLSASVSSISMHMNNLGIIDLSMRISVQGTGGNFWSVSPVVIPAQSGWQVVHFSLASSDLTGGANLNQTLGNVIQFRILHSVSGSSAGDIVVANLGIDNISAAEEPLPVELVSFSAIQKKQFVILNWITVSELNNRGFEIERKIYFNEQEDYWTTIGFKKGVGTSTFYNKYDYVDDLSKINTDKVAYRLKQIDFDGAYTYSNTIYVNKIILKDFHLGQNYPNPFNPITRINFNLPNTEFVSLIIYDTVGKQIAELISEKKEAGNYTIEYDASKFSSGIYYYKLKAGSLSDIKKMVLLK